MGTINLDNTGGHWVTIEGNHILIKDSIGGGRGFSKAAIERKLLAHHEAQSGDESARLNEEDATQQSGGGATTFRRDSKTKSGLPSNLEDQFTAAEIGQMKQRGILKVTDNPGTHAGGLDAISESGMGIDRYTSMVRRSLDASHSRMLEAAKATAHASNDPEMQFTAAIHDNMPSGAERANTGTIAADKLKVGQEFQIHGQSFRVVENEDGMRVLATPPGFPAEVPLDALNKVPIDRGSLRQTRTKATKGDAVPFSRIVYLSLPTPTDLKPAVTLGQGYPTHLKVKVGNEDRQVPVAYFWKDTIQAGDYVHPATNQKLNVDAGRIDGWVDKFHQMRAAGIEIPTPTDHSHQAKDNLGFVVDAKRNGDRLSLLHQVIGEDAAMTALRNRCSLCIEPDYVDEKGRKWGDVFTHSAFTPVPVVSGMGSFVPFAASRDRQTETPIFYLSADERNPDMDFKQLREALGATADVPDDQLLTKVKELKTSAATALSRATAAETKVTELDAKVITLSRTPTPPDPEALRDRMELSIGKIDLAIAKGDLTPAIADKLKAKVGTLAAPNAFMLSRSADLGDRPVDFLLSLFEGAQLAPRTGSQTGLQLLSRETPGGETDKPVNQEDIKARAAAIGALAK
jgi:hypothetical protein